jgi:hypothetical protein
MKIETLTLAGEEYVVLPKAEYLRLVGADEETFDAKTVVLRCSRCDVRLQSRVSCSSFGAARASRRALALRCRQPHRRGRPPLPFRRHASASPVVSSRPS